MVDFDIFPVSPSYTETLATPAFQGNVVSSWPDPKTTCLTIHDQTDDVDSKKTNIAKSLAVFDDFPEGLPINFNHRVGPKPMKSNLKNSRTKIVYELKRSDSAFQVSLLSTLCLVQALTLVLPLGGFGQVVR